MSKLYQPNVKSLRPTVQQQRGFKLFKLEVESAATMALKAQKELAGVYKVMIGSMECIFYPLNQRAIDKAMKRFTTTRW